jgi:hypothetical protein
MIAGNDHGRQRYREALERENRALDEALADIRQRQDSGQITVRQAADERVEVLERHLASVRLLREMYGDS